jgi:DNA (cytosine-5)-methyltransferase 1
MGETPRVGSLCTGIGGLDLAVEAHFGAELAWYSEIEPAPCTVLEREWPGVPNLGDLTVLDWSQVPPVDILTAGYPCQPFSTSGKRKGASDERHLWPFIADAVRHLRPRHVVLENVAGHLSLGFGTVLGDLAEAGFDAEWVCLRASEVGCCHARARVFIVAADTRGERTGREPRAISRAVGGARRPNRGVRASVDARPGAALGLLPTPAAADGERTSQTYGRGNPTLAGAVTSLLPSPRTSDTNGPGEHGDGGLDLRTAVSLLPTPRSSGKRTMGEEGPYHADGYSRASIDDVARAADDRWVATLPDGRVVDYGPAIQRWERIFGEAAPAPRDNEGRLYADLPRWMMGYPADWLSGLGRTQRLKAAGNAVVPQQAAAALRELVA